jgi:hypothetical protein
MAKPSEETKAYIDAYADGYAAAVADILAFLKKQRSGLRVTLEDRVIALVEKWLTRGYHVGSGNEDGK